MEEIEINDKIMYSLLVIVVSAAIAGGVSYAVTNSTPSGDVAELSAELFNEFNDFKADYDSKLAALKVDDIRDTATIDQDIAALKADMKDAKETISSLNLKMAVALTNVGTQQPSVGSQPVISTTDYVLKTLDSSGAEIKHPGDKYQINDIVYINGRYSGTDNTLDYSVLRPDGTRDSGNASIPSDGVFTFVYLNTDIVGEYKVDVEIETDKVDVIDFTIQ